MEQRCEEISANCVCSEPFNTLTYTPVGSSWYNPADSTVKECTSDSFTDPVYKGASVMRNDNDLSGSNAFSILNALPAGNKVNYVLRAADGHLGGWMAGHDMKSFGGDGRFVKRMAVRWYRYYSPNYAFDSQDDLGCDQGLKWSEWSAGHRVTLSYYTPSFSTYNYLMFSPSSDCCWAFVSYPDNKAAFRGKWWRFEAVFTNRNGPAYNMQVYVKDVTDNGPETKVIDLQQYGLPGSPSISPPIPGLTPSEQQTLFLINNYRQGSSCPGFSAISHYMLAGWDTDQGQRIGAAYEVEGGGSTPDIIPPTLSNGQPSGTLPSGTTSTTISVATNENANCKYSTTAGVGYSSMTNTFSTTGGTTHSTLLTGLVNGQTYTRYVKCQDSSGNTNTNDFIISFSVSISTRILFYVRAGATGRNDGSDWNNAYVTLPASLQRGATYYISVGTYPGYTFDDPVSGTQIILVKRAIASDHGTDTGWNSNYGNAVALFTGSLNFDTGYYVFDGQTGGGPNSWKSGHGFKIEVDTSTDGISTASSISDISILHTEVTQTGNTISPGSSQGGTTGNAFFNNNIANDMLFSYVYFHHLKGLPLFMRDGSNMVIEYSYFADPCGVSLYNVNEHCEHLVTHAYDNLIARYNIFKDIRSTGGLVNNDGTSENWEVYGNVFYVTQGSALLSVAADSQDHSLNFKIFNNDFIQGGSLKFIMDNSNHLVYNNIFYNGEMFSLPQNHDYNYYSNSSSLLCDMDFTSHENGVKSYPSNCDTLSAKANPFTNIAVENFSLSAPLSGWNGINICSLQGITCDVAHPYNKDIFGKTRGLDGVWDRGAIEFTGVFSSFDFLISNAGSKTITQGQSTTNTITTTLSSGTTQSVSFSSSGFPTGATYSFSPTTCAPTCTTTLSINTINSIPLGNYTINVNGIGGGLTRTTNFRLTINPIIVNSCSWDFFPRDIPDGKVTLGDVLVVVGDFGKTSASPGFNSRMDFNNNNQIDLFDVLSVVAHFGGC